MTKKICLASIVKNESKIILRMLESVLPVVDFVCISDTGSTDDTISKAKKYLKDKKTKFRFFNDKWSDFGTNRSLSIANAKKAFPEADYLLFIDADMVLKVSDTFDKNKLTLGYYTVLQKNESISYYNIRLIDTSHDWSCVGRTHEYYDIKNKNKFEVSNDKLDDIYIDDREDGGSKADKYSRDHGLLTKDYEEDPTNVRTFFYLGQTCGALKKYEEAIKWYEKRSESGGFEEEAWYSLIRIGDIYRDIKEPDKAIMYYLKAHRRRQWRAEPAYKVANLFSDLKDYRSCYYYALMASEIVWPKDDVLFIDGKAHGYGPLVLLNISSFYIKKHKEGVDATFKLLGRNDVPEYINKLVLSNLNYYCNSYGFSFNDLAPKEIEKSDKK
jgi:tetratricopeptide (TPR) repeat protein